MLLPVQHEAMTHRSECSEEAVNAGSPGGGVWPSRRWLDLGSCQAWVWSLPAEGLN